MQGIRCRLCRCSNTAVLHTQQLRHQNRRQHRQRLLFDQFQTMRFLAFVKPRSRLIIVLKLQ